MELTNDQLGHIKSLGGLKTPIEHIPLVLDFSYEDGKELIKELENEQSEAFRAYHSGVEKANVAIKKSLYDKAKKGDVFAIMELNKIQAEEAENSELKRMYK